MKRKVNNLSQECFDYFTPISKWPDGYKDNLSSVGGTLWHSIYGMDIETEGLNPYDHKMRIISVACSPEHTIAFSSYTLNGFDKFDLECFTSLLENPDILLIGHNIKYDINWVRIKYPDIDVKCQLFDTMFAQYLLDENIEFNSLGYLVSKYIPELGGYKEVVNRANLKLAAKDDVLIYNCKDADASRRLFDVLMPKLHKGGYDKLMITSSLVLPILSKMETKGIYLDKEWANKTQVKLFNELVSSRYNMAEIAQTTFDPSSHQSLSNVLYKKFKFDPVKHTKTGQASTDAESLGYLYDQVKEEKQGIFLDAIISYKKKEKLLTTYYQPIERWTQYDGRVHTTYSLGKQRNEEASGGTVTGRLSSNNPNLQNIPRGKENRGMFAASPQFTFLDGDFSQLELRVAAFLSQEPVMLDAFHNGLDIHTAVMSELTSIPYNTLVSELDGGNAKLKNDRVAFKEVNFGIFYQMSAQRLQRTLRIKAGIRKTVEECQTYINAWFGKYPKAKRWIDQTKLCAVNFKQVSMPLGQKRRLPEAGYDNPIARKALRQATNFPVQSFASWICLIGLVLQDQYFQENKELDGHILLQVHDSVTSEVKLLNSLGNLNDIESIKVDIQKIMEKDTLSYIKDVFEVDFNCPLEFKVNIQERWS